MTSLAEWAIGDAEIRKILDDASIGHRTAARMINDQTGDDVSTSEKSVRRYRKSRMSQETLTSPYPPLADALIRNHSPRATPSWTPGIDIDPALGGEFRTQPVVVDYDAVGTPELDDADLLREFDLDPAIWEVTSARKSQWQSGDRWLEARKVSFRKRVGLTSLGDIEAIMARYNISVTPLQPMSDVPERIVMVPAGDLQLGKQEGGGTAATIDRFCRITNDIADNLRSYLSKQALILPWLGDCIEGVVSLKGRAIATLDISITEQVRVYRRLMMHQIATLAPLASKVLIPVVPGNHDETTRQQIMPMSDSWAVEGASAVADWMAGRPEFAHVEFVFPPGDEPGITVNVGDADNPHVIGFIHGHTTGSTSATIINWWKGQSHGRQPMGRADMLVSAHYHHLRVEHTGGNRTWLQIPALDGGSAWYRNKSGNEAPTGLVVVEITPGTGQGWRNLTVMS